MSVWSTRLALAMVLGLLGAAAVPAQEPKEQAPVRGTFQRTRDVIYGRKFGMALTLDVFAPTRSPNGAGILFFISGGWISDSQYIDPYFVTELCRRGYTVFA